MFIESVETFTPSNTSLSCILRCLFQSLFVSNDLNMPSNKWYDEQYLT